MYFFADYHMHTKHSDGRATVEEMIQAGREKGLEEIAITDHGPKNIGTGVKNPEQYLKIKQEVKELNAQFKDIKVFCGAEADLIDLDGSIDIPKKICRELDLLLVGLHPYVWPKNFSAAGKYVLGNQLAKYSSKVKSKVTNNNTKALLEAIYKHDVDIVTHPGLGMPLHLQEVARACAAKNTAFEINVGHRYQSFTDIMEVARTGVNFVVNSDAHFTTSVGELTQGKALLTQAKIPVEQVLNARE
ncbi:PHP domain-containing protein [Bacillota bacterium LX-D]|nr:PHP domain-containing protein [Bacillota bacterium LX-D]